jgi:hypothetical protein
MGTKNYPLLGVFAKFAKSGYRLRHVSVCVRMEQLGSHWTQLHEISTFEYFSKIRREKSALI